MAKAQDIIGKHGQDMAAAALRRLGVEMVEKIGTPVKVIPMGQKNGHPVYRVIYGEKVSGNHRGILQPSGRSVLAETKTMINHNLKYSDFQDHQPGRLTLHADFGGISLVVWVHESGVYIMRWPIPGFMPGKSIKPAQAQDLNIESLEGLEDSQELFLKKRRDYYCTCVNPSPEGPAFNPHCGKCGRRFT